MPGPEQTTLSKREVRELLEAERAIAEARLNYAATVRRLGISACARALGITPSAMSERIRRIEAAHGQAED
jgi:DNA-binding Lrp family transcriptional regulator